MLCFVQTVNVYFAVNAVNRSNTLMNSNFINEWGKPLTKLQVQLFVPTEQLLIGPVRYVNFTNH